MTTVVENAEETVTLTPSTDIEQYLQVLESLGISPEFNTQLATSSQSAETVVFNSAVKIAFDFVQNDTVDISSSNVLELILVLGDTLHIQEAVTNQLQAVVALAAALAIQDVSQQGAEVELAEVISLTQEYAAGLIAAAEAQETLTLAGEGSYSATFYTVVDDSVAISDDTSFAQMLTEVVSEGVSFNAIISLGDAVYAAWVVNAGAAKGISRYDNFDFNSLAEISGRFYGAADDGIYELVGDDDSGTAISASVKSFLLDFGSANNKRVEEAYIAVRSSGDLVMKVITTLNGVKTEAWYECVREGVEGNRRCTPGKGLKGVYWQFNLVNVAGADFDIDKLHLVPVELSRRI